MAKLGKLKFATLWRRPNPSNSTDNSSPTATTPVDRTAPQDGPAMDGADAIEDAMVEAAVHQSLSGTYSVNELELWLEAKSQIEDSQPWRDYDAVTKLEALDSTKTIADVVMASLKIARDNYKDSQWSYTRKNGKKIVFAGIVDDIILCLESVKGFGAAAATCDPTKATSVAWAGIQLMVMAIRDLVLDDQGSIAQIVQCCAIMEKDYLRNLQTRNLQAGRELRKTLVELYQKILLYQVKAHEFINKQKLVSALSAFVPGQVRTVHKAMEDVKRLFSRVKDWQQNIHGALLQTTTNAVTEHQTAIRAMESSLVELLRNVNQNLKEAQPPPIELKLLGTEATTSVTYPFDEETAKISATPKWLRLLFLYQGSFPNDSRYVEDELQRHGEPGNEVRRINTLDLWRIFCATISYPSRAMVDENVQVNNMIFRLMESQSPSTTVLTEFVGAGDGGMPMTEVPSLHFAKQMIRQATVTAGGGACGETYYTSNKYDALCFPLAFCVVEIPEYDQLYPARWLPWGVNMQINLAHIVKGMWLKHSGVTAGGYDRSEVVRQYCNSVIRVTTTFDSYSFWRLQPEAKRYFSSVFGSRGFEIEDVVTVLRLVEQSVQNGHVIDDLESTLIRDHAIAYFGDGAMWLLLAVLLNLG